jgi:hypothetical protein
VVYVLAGLERDECLPDVGLCKGYQCDLYGDPNLNGLCSECYRRHIMRKKPSQVKVITAINSQFEIGSTSSVDHSLNRAMEDVQKGKSQSHSKKYEFLCKIPNCENFGNPQAEGYCNKCFTEYRHLGVKSCCDR